MIPKGIMLHSTGCNNPNLKRYVGPDDGLLGASNNHWNIPLPDGREVCVHGFVGKLANGSIATYQTLPWDMRGWHGGGSVNNTHIGFEICEDDCTSAEYFKVVYQEAVELCAYLCKMFKLDPLADGVLICHCEGYKRGIASNHSDVMHWFPKYGKNMDIFRQDVKKLLTSPTLAPTTPSPITSYPISENNIKALVTLGIIKTPEYWRNLTSIQWLDLLMANAAKSEVCDIGINNGITKIDMALDVLVDAGIVTSLDYWKDTLNYIDLLLINIANKCRIVLEKIVHAEANGEGLEGQELVANVIMNRCDSKNFPNEIYNVVFEPKQFTPITDGAYAKAKPSESVKQAVTNVLNGKDASKGALFFCTKASAANPNSWHEKALTFLFEYKNHRFYK
jgi:hypothetical protein